MKWWLLQSCVVISGLAGPVAFAQGKAGGPPGGGRGPSPEEQQRAVNAKQWGDNIEKVRAQAPPPPLPTIRFPTENEKLVARLRMAEDPKKELAQYLDKLWKDAKEAPARKVALDGIWRDAEKPKWARAAIEDYYRKHADGAELRQPPQQQLAPTPPPPAPATTVTASPSASAKP